MKLYVESLPDSLLHSFDHTPAVTLRHAEGNCVELDYQVKMIFPAAVIEQVSAVTEIKDMELNEISIEESVKKYFFYMG